jgi:succinate dehydrogenase / fumarate reductase, cytochrome b subunit
MKRIPTLAVWLWTIQALTGLLLVLYVIIHTADNATILFSTKSYEDMLSFWHHTLPHWFYILMVLGLAGIFLIHTFNGIRIASKPYKDIDVSWKHNVKLLHSGTMFWYTQVITGSAIAIFGIWHLIIQHGSVATQTAAQSAERMSITVFLIYLIFLAALMFHSFNGVRSVIIKLGYMTDKGKEAILVGLAGLLILVFFFTGAAGMAKFLAPPSSFETGSNASVSVTTGNE